MAALPPLPPARNRSEVSAPRSQNGEEGKITEYLMIRLVTDLKAGETEVAFEGQGFDDANDEIILDILNTAASVYDYVLVAEEDVEYEAIETGD